MRIPHISEITPETANKWFQQLDAANLLFHPEDDPATIIARDGTPVCTPDEVDALRETLARMETELGHDGVISAAYPVCLAALGTPTHLVTLTRQVTLKLELEVSAPDEEQAKAAAYIKAYDSDALQWHVASEESATEFEVVRLA